MIMRIASIALIGMAGAAIVLALWAVGGPGQARAERRDQTRMNDLHSLGQHLACLHRQGLGQDERSPLCPEAARRADPLTGQPYRIAMIADDGVRVCAAFETDAIGAWWSGRDDFDRDSGCLVVRLPEGGRG